ncbi:MAG: tRNA lysidine(34) synthetase TilS [Pseudomonadota bacterium]
MPIDVPRAFQAALADHADHWNAPLIGLAVSGGGDSTAMLHLAARFFRHETLRVITVDHGLRAEAAVEIAQVADQSAALGIPHQRVTWRWDGQGNLQAAARAGRWAAISEWALAAGIGHVWLGHTEDDQIETLLMRLARGSGVDGLTGMFPASKRDGLSLFRPLLRCSREALRNWLRAENINWSDDPSNDDPRFDRVKARQMIDQLAALGMTRKRLLQTAAHMQAAQMTLQRAAFDLAQTHVAQDTGDLLLAPPVLDVSADDAPRRVIAAALLWVGGGPYRPRFDSMIKAVDSVAKGATVTLAGCVLCPNGDGRMRIAREAAATPVVRRATLQNAAGVTWDKRWFLAGPLKPDYHYAALGEGLADCPDWRNVGLPRRSLLASPAVWHGSGLIAAPVAGLANGWSAQIVADFHSSAFAIED